MVSTPPWLSDPVKVPAGLIAALDRVKVSRTVLLLGTHASRFEMVTSWTCELLLETYIVIVWNESAVASTPE